MSNQDFDFNNSKCIDLRGVDVKETLNRKPEKYQILKQDEEWEHSIVCRSVDFLGFPTVVKNKYGVQPDNKYYLYYAHHDPKSGIGCAVADSIVSIEGLGIEFIKLAQRDSNRGDSQILTIPDKPDICNESHYSSPCVVWNEDEQCWFMYFHYLNCKYEKWQEENKDFTGLGRQMTTLATCSDLSSHEWDIYTHPKYSEVSSVDVNDIGIVPILPTKNEDWIRSASSYHAIQRLPNGKWLAFMRGTAIDESTALGFARSSDGRIWDYSLFNNPVIHSADSSEGRKEVYRPGFIGYMGTNGYREDKYLLAWTESPPTGDVPYLRLGFTKDFIHIDRAEDKEYKIDLTAWNDNRKALRAWDGIISPWRENNKLYLFSGKYVYVFQNVPISSEYA